MSPRYSLPSPPHSNSNPPSYTTVPSSSSSLPLPLPCPPFIRKSLPPKTQKIPPLLRIKELHFKEEEKRRSPKPLFSITKTILYPLSIYSFDQIYNPSLLVEMTPSYDCMSSTLLCAEDTSSILGFDDEEESVQGKRPGWVTRKRNDFYGDSLMVFPLQSDECLARMVEREPEHLPRWDYAERLRSGALDLSIRRESIDWIWKVHAHYNFGPLSAYLSVNYLDRFLSAYELPQGNTWMMQLLSVACLTLAAKMEETEVPLLLDLQVGKSKYVFEARTIQRMELLVLKTLKWRMQAVTPFSFIDYFLHKFNDGNSPTKLLMSQSMELILNTVEGTDFLAFRPSEIAAAVALSVLGETQTVDVERGVSCCNHIAKERVLRCYEVIQENILRPLKNASLIVSSVPRSPIAVLDAACLSYKSDDITVGSHAKCHDTSPASKRRKISTSSIP